MHTAIVGVGANLGDRERTIHAAIDALGEHHVVAQISPLYETEPVGPPQPMFLNGAVRIDTTYAPEALLDDLLRIERSLGRVRDQKWGPRTIDLDLLWLSSGEFHSGRLDVPHPHLLERAFALAPLLDVLSASDPAYRAYAARLAQLGSPPRIAALNKG